MAAGRQFDVQFLGETKRVVAGRINDAGDGLAEPMDDVSDNAVQAVAEYVIANFDGAVEVDYADGVTYQIQVVKIGPPHADGSRFGLHPGGMIVGYTDQVDAER